MFSFSVDPNTLIFNEVWTLLSGGRRAVFGIWKMLDEYEIPLSCSLRYEDCADNEPAQRYGR